MQYQEQSSNNLLILIILLAIFAFLIRVDFIYYILYLCIGIFIWNWWAIRQRMRKLEVERRFLDRAFWGDRVEVDLVIKNDSRLPIPWFEIYESLALELGAQQPVNHVFALAPREERVFTYDFHARRRGYYRMGPTRMKTGDLFGLSREVNSVLKADYLTVYPRIYSLHQLGLSSRLPFGTISSRERLFEDPARPVGVRDFRSGDSIRQINWKVSAHTQNLVVKTLQPAISLETILILNLYRPDYSRWSRASRMEWSIEVAASIAAYLNQRKQAVGLMSNGIDPLDGEDGLLRFDDRTGRLILNKDRNPRPVPPIPPKPSRANLIKLLEQLARIESSGKIEFIPWLTAQPIPLSWGGSAVVITPTADATLCNHLHRLVRQGINPTLMVTERQTNFPEIMERSRRLGYKALQIYERKDLDEHARQ